ncbi:MAG: hypothetical protein ACLPY2_26510 [Bryobacteraceae bacterium]|jgi:hypothetical protein
MAAAKPPQVSEYAFQIAIFDVRCGSIQSIRRAGSEVIDRIACCANRGGSRVERIARLLSRLSQFPACGPAQVIHRLFGPGAKL